MNALALIPSLLPAPIVAVLPRALRRAPYLTVSVPASPDGMLTCDSTDAVAATDAAPPASVATLQDVHPDRVDADSNGDAAVALGAEPISPMPGLGACPLDRERWLDEARGADDEMDRAES